MLLIFFCRFVTLCPRQTARKHPPHFSTPPAHHSTFHVQSHDRRHVTAHLACRIKIPSTERAPLPIPWPLRSRWAARDSPGSDAITSSAGCGVGGSASVQPRGACEGAGPDTCTCMRGALVVGCLVWLQSAGAGPRWGMGAFITFRREGGGGFLPAHPLSASSNATSLCSLAGRAAGNVCPASEALSGSACMRFVKRSPVMPSALEGRRGLYRHISWGTFGSLSLLYIQWQVAATTSRR